MILNFVLFLRLYCNQLMKHIISAINAAKCADIIFRSTIEFIQTNKLKHDDGLSDLLDICISLLGECILLANVSGGRRKSYVKCLSSLIQPSRNIPNEKAILDLQSALTGFQCDK